MDEREQQAAIDRAAQHLRRSARLYERDFCPGLATDFRFAADKLDPPAPPTPRLPPEFKVGDWVQVKGPRRRAGVVVRIHSVERYPSGSPIYTVGDVGLFLASDLAPCDPPAPPEPKFEKGQWVRHEDGRCGRVDKVSTCHPRSYAVAWCNEACWCNWTPERELTRWFAPGTLVTDEGALGVVDQHGTIIWADNGNARNQAADWKSASQENLLAWVAKHPYLAIGALQYWAKRLYGQPAAAGEGK